MEKYDIQITYDPEGGYSFNFKDFEAYGFFKGYVLFQASRKAFNKYYGYDNHNFKNFLESVIANTPFMEEEEKLAFELTQNAYFDADENRIWVYDWDETGHMLMNWTHVFELEEKGSTFSLIYSVYNGDYGIDGCGWNVSDARDDFLTNDFMDLNKLIESNNGDTSPYHWNDLSLTSIYDATGKCVFLVEDNIKCFADVRMVDYLFNDELQFINEDIRDEINASLKEIIP